MKKDGGSKKELNSILVDIAMGNYKHSDIHEHDNVLKPEDVKFRLMADESEKDKK